MILAEIQQTIIFAVFELGKEGIILRILLRRETRKNVIRKESH